MTTAQTTAQSDIILERMTKLHPKVMDLTLDRVHRLLAALGHPERKLPPVIHIAGTNGKGSTLAMLRAGLEGAGKRVHAYSSPHLARFHERIRLAGTLITEDALTLLLDECMVANNQETITYFEITTIAGIYAFSQVEADYTLLEVGLGGVLDATNVVDEPALCVIAPVSLDHTQFLGDTVAEIAAEKAGIIKRGVPCVVGAQVDEALEVIEAQAAKLGAPLYVRGQHWHVWEERGRLVFQDENGLLDLPLPALPGAHQVENAGMVIAGLRVLEMNEAACEAAMAATWPARMQRLSTGHLAQAAGQAELWLDGGHNPAAGEAIAKLLASMAPRPTYLICGMLSTKDVTGYMAPLAVHVAGLTAVSIPGETATLPAEETARLAASVGMAADVAVDVEVAINAIVARDPMARILICGSLYLAGEVLRRNGTLPT